VGRAEIQDASSGVNSRFCVDSASPESGFSAGFTVPGGGLRRILFFVWKSWRRREGTPTVMVHDEDIWERIEGRSGVVAGRSSSKSQCVLRARRGTVERDLGRIIQRTMRDWIMGLMDDARREERKDGIVVVGERARRWRVQRGIVGKEDDVLPERLINGG
jgi:hypothetical protein